MTTPESAGRSTALLLPSAAGSSPAPGARSRLPPERLAAAGKRVSLLAFFCLLTTAFVGIANYQMQAELMPHLFFQIKLGVVMMLLSAGMIILERSGALTPARFLNLAAVYIVSYGFFLAAFEHSRPWPEGAPLQGSTWLALWVLLSGILVPNPSPRVALTAFLTSLVGPLAYWFDLRVLGMPEMHLSGVFYLSAPPFLMGAWAVFLNRNMYRLELDLDKARRLGSYHLEARLGEGGMGEVWRATHSMLARPAAIKLIRDISAELPASSFTEYKLRFEREARITASLRSPHTVQLYDFGVNSAGSFYYVMELLDGLDLESLMRRFGPQPAARVAHILRQACDSLAEAHERGLVHRDIKPQNLFLCRLGRHDDFVKVLDFGLVKPPQEAGDPNLTSLGAATGTPAYIAPECALGEASVDGRADLYCLGAVAYWLLTGGTVFPERQNAIALISAHIHEIPLPPTLRTEVKVSAALETLIMQCLAKQPAARPASATELLAALAALPEAGGWSEDNAHAWWRENFPVRP
jgi:serine/threonine-protein kinase